MNAVVGAGWFWTPFKCSTHRRSRSSRVGSVLPFPSLIGAPLPDGELVSSQTNARIDFQLLVPRSLSDRPTRSQLHMRALQPCRDNSVRNRSPTE